MELLLNPNIAYLLLVLGFILILLAIITPGTGMLEVGALFCLASAGYTVYNLGFNLWALIVLILSLIPFIYAIRKPKREWALALSILGVIAGSVYLFPTRGFKPAVNPIIAIIISLLTAGFLWLIIRKTQQAFLARPSHDLEALIGQVGETKTRVHEEGSVQVAGELWTARSEKPIPSGSNIHVVGREGLILIIKQEIHSKKQ